MEPGPPYTIAGVEQLATGGVRVRVRIRGGRRLRLYVPPGLDNGPAIDQLITNVVGTMTGGTARG